ncbi:MAG: VOC family protein [Acetobacteraceae bacterium]|nr:VOC family protein [Acetobacteraceae bacterium]
MTANQFVWYELVTSDIDAALRFYGEVLGWESQDFPGSPQRYAIVNAKGAGVGGVMQLPEGMSQPFWLGYIATPDIDDAVARFKTSGGSLHKGPWEIPGVGRLALLSDPQGAALAFIQGASEQPSQAFDQGKPGHGHWHELHTTDPVAAFAFYAEQFGWSKGDAMDMGPMGTYQIFKSGSPQIGGMLKAQDGQRPGWLYYFGTESIRAGVERIGGAGGAVLREPAEIPGGAFIIHAKDPQGAMFALVGPA